MSTAATEALKVIAQDADDLAVISAALQDAVTKIGDIRFDPAARSLTIALNRFRWEGGAQRGQRIRAALQLGSVLAVKARRLRQDAPDAVLALLSIDFEPTETPGGVVAFVFAGGGDLRCEVECLDLVAADISQPWPARSAPNHDKG